MRCFGEKSFKEAEVKAAVERMTSTKRDVSTCTFGVVEGGEVDSKLLPKETVGNGWSRQGNGMACYFHRTPVSARYAARSYFDVDFVGYCRQDDLV